MDARAIQKYLFVIKHVRNKKDGTQAVIGGYRRRKYSTQLRHLAAELLSAR